MSKEVNNGGGDALSQIELPDRHSFYGHLSSRPNSQGYRGIHFDLEHSKWRATITYLGKRIRLGRFRSPETAAYAYNVAAQKFYGPFAIVNDIQGQRTIRSLPEPRKRVKRRLRRFYERRKSIATDEQGNVSGVRADSRCDFVAHTAAVSGVA